MPVPPSPSPNRPSGPLAILETVLYCRDLDAAEKFYADLLGLELVESKEDRHRFFQCGARMLLVFNPAHATLKQERVAGEKIPKHGAWGRGHIAFGADAAQIEAWKAFLKDHAIEIESEIAWPQGGRSIYFRDPEQNSIEIASPEIWHLDPQPDLFPPQESQSQDLPGKAGSLR
jgi:catechol 2,3-dioxygenase-like lactoylglutathione lyase family enzyme